MYRTHPLALARQLESVRSRGILFSWAFERQLENVLAVHTRGFQEPVGEHLVRVLEPASHQERDDATALCLPNLARKRGSAATTSKAVASCHRCSLPPVLVRQQEGEALEFATCASRRAGRCTCHLPALLLWGDFSCSLPLKQMLLY